MYVIRARVSGFCMGVRRAVNMAVEAAVESTNVYTLGPLIHNPRVLEDLDKKGIKILEEEISAAATNLAAEESTVIIRAHGVCPNTEAELIRSGFRVIDATCPHVKLSQEKAMNYAQMGYVVFLAGEKDHAEISGLRGYVEAPRQPGPTFPFCYVIGNPGEAEKAGEELFRRDPAAQAVLIGQTTISPNEYKAIGEKLRHFFPSLEILDTICGATAARQTALRELCAQAEAVIVAGGRESANSKRLLSLACELGKPAWLIETAEEIPPEIKQFETVGLAAGASTPDTLINEIETKLVRI
jgi:4-hydroxy-3-methylbut-2-enyl diphosphate reductase